MIEVVRDGAINISDGRCQVYLPAEIVEQMGLKHKDRLRWRLKEAAVDGKMIVIAIVTKV